jgi:hypothetical protein
MSRGLNGETVMNREVVVGTVPGEEYGYKRNLQVTVDIRMERRDRQAEYETTDHRKVSEPLDFSITTAVWRPDGKDSVGGGATCEPLRQLVTWAPGFDAEKAAQLADLGAEWNLSGMQAGCAHQAPVWKEGREGREYDLDRTPPCPETGHKFGHAWLVRELPDGFQDLVTSLLPAGGH